MSSYFLFYVLLLLLLHTTGSCNGDEVKCIEKEKQALLKFKQDLIDDSAMLSTWRYNDQSNATCCKWKGIACSNETSHVVMIDLHGFDTHLAGVVDFTSLIELQNLEYLDFSVNGFTGSQIPEFIGSFSKLRYLNLSYSSFGGRIPYQLGNIPQLKYLNLRANYFVGAIPYQLGKLMRLRYLDLSGNDLDGEIPYQLGNLAQLEYLDLGENSLSGAIPFKIGNLPMLHTLKLGSNSGLNITNIDWWLSNLTSLTNLDLSSLPYPGSSNGWLQTIGKLLPNLNELRLSDCSLTDNDILSLFNSSSNNSTSLTILDLSSNLLTSSIFQWVKNISFDLKELYLSYNDFVLSSSPPFLNFPSLVILDLSYNNLTPLVFQGNFNFGSNIKRLYLENCSLSHSNFLVSSAFIMNSSSSLVTLDLSSNLLTSSAIFPWLFNFTTNLHQLFLDYNLLQGPIPESLGKAMNSLEDLMLTNNRLQGNIPSSLGNMCTLQRLYLTKNNLSGEISNFIQNSSRCNRFKFQVLDICNNHFTGMLPDLSIFPFLRELCLSSNQLSGKIPESIGLLYELETLLLSGNSMQGDVTESHLTNLSKLEILDLSYNPVSLKVGISWVPSFQLIYLRLSSCKLGPSFPSWLQTQNHLIFLDISDAEISDYVPEGFWNKLQYIRETNMSHNNLKGTIPNLQLKLFFAPGIILDSNQFEGGVPSFLSQASQLFLSKNKFSNLSTFLCGKSDFENLFSLDLSRNQIKGQIPDCWNALQSTLFLDLSNNKLSGKIPSSMGNLVKLKALILRSNGLTGELPSSLKNCANLLMLDIAENMLSGPIPSWIGESLQQLMILSLQMNHFSGNFPLHLCYLRQIQLLDLSRNNLSEGIPTCLKNFTAMSERSINSIQTLGQTYWYNGTLHSIYGNYIKDYELYISLMWKGMKYEFINPELLLKSIDLSSNNLTGEIPKELGDLLGLVSLNLSRNNLRGEIIAEIGNLKSLEFLDLSRNHFLGIIPSTITQIDRLAMVDLSHNSLSGKIPLGTQLQSFNASSFEGNLDLCGKPLSKSCPGDETPIQPQEPAAGEKDENSIFHEALYMSLGIGFFTGFWGFWGPILLWRPWRYAYLRFLNNLIDNVYVMVAVNMAKYHRWRRG